MLLFNPYRLRVCVTLLQGIVGDVKGYTRLSFSCFHVRADLFSVENAPSEPALTHQRTHSFLPLTDACTQVKQTNGNAHLMHALLSISRLPNSSRLGVTVHPNLPTRPISVSFTFYCSVFMSHIRMREKYFMVEFTDARAPFDSSHIYSAVL